MLLKSIINKILNINSILIILYYNSRLKLEKKIYKSYYKNKQQKFQLKDLITYLLKSSKKLIFAYIIKT